MSASKRPPPRQWAIDSDNPCIERTPEEAAAYFKRCREASGRRLRENAPIIAALLDKQRLLMKKGRLDA
jgi:hypothetical protein